ncbi:DUF484 family protein [Robbsia sp. Bb-Pol-6]|uniref:DUF484 family protein n=1 Tax=Robbsia betulipollinis TaxID=2981849 RepID=A0ABT3ZKH3_9BURK|nr:DUF484 family protein [Robbsia betulipollinis]MCY0386917.1 DUF484 family protein [Robbsia betulipollinis]
MNESDVADFLLAHPAFFERHAEVLGHIRLGNPHGGRAVSLPERQIAMFREKNGQLERRMGELVRYGHENDSHAVKFDRWSARLLATRHGADLPDAICDGLREIFDVPQAAVRLWGVDDTYAAHPAARFAGHDVARFTDGLGAPYCGANSGFAAAAWLAEGTDAPRTASIALVPLRAPHADSAHGAFGLLALGSPDPQRFHADLGTDFLARLGALAGAALSRMLAP